jgi:soluble lytic murein transglycosylase-like protein
MKKTNIIIKEIQSSIHEYAIMTILTIIINIATYQTYTIIAKKNTSKKIIYNKQTIIKTKYSKTNQYINHYAIKYNIKPALIKGIIKVESNNGKYILSQTGACGLMQIEPYTAKAITGENISCSELIQNKKLNIKIGTIYLKTLLTKFAKLSYAIAAYNAGPTRVYSWINNLGYIPESNNLTNNTYGYVIKVINYTNKLLINKVNLSTNTNNILI